MAKVKLKTRLNSLLRGDLRSTGEEKNTVTSRSVRPSGITLSVVRGRLEKEDVDVLVNSLSVSMNVEHGILTTAVSARAGPGLQKAVDEFPGPAKYGDVFKTAGFKLKARAVYHVVVCGFNYPDAGDVLEGLVLRCLELADSEKRTSVSIPALGTGRHAFPPFVVAHRMVEAVRRYEDKMGRAMHLKQVRFVLMEPRCLNAFQTTLNEIPHASQKMLVERLKKTRKSPFSLKSVRMKPSEYQASEEATTEMDGAASPPPPPASDVHMPRAKRPNKLHTKLVKALGVHKAFKKEQLINQLRSMYRELPLPAAFVPSPYVLKSREQIIRSNDLDALLEATVGAEAHRRRHLVLVHGLTYIGKSSLVNRIARLWADGGLRHIRLVILVNLQVLLAGGNSKTPSLRECLLQCFASADIDTAGGYELFESSNGKMLLLIDDAEAWSEHFRDELRLDPLFAKTHVIVTSRTPSAKRLAASFNPKLTVELCGFESQLIWQFLLQKRPHFDTAEEYERMTYLVDTAKNLSMLQTPGWLAHSYEVISKGDPDLVQSNEVLQTQRTLVNTHLEMNTEAEWLREFREKELRLGESFLYFLIYKRDPAWSKFEKLDLLNVGVSPRVLIDYCIASYIVHKVGKDGSPPAELSSMERVYLVQTSLEMACGHDQATPRAINKMVSVLADEDTEVQCAREHALEENEESARTLKRLNDLQVACLRQSSTPPLGTASQDVPEELQYLGAEYARVYLLACEQGTKSVKRTRVMLVGHFGAGKTSLKRRLVNEDFNAEYLITNGIDADPSACTIQVDDTCNWSIIQKALRDVNFDEHSSEVARVLYNFIKKLKSSELPVSDEPELPTPDVDQPDVNIDFQSFSRSDSEKSMLDEIDGPMPSIPTNGDHLDVDQDDRSQSTTSSQGSHPRPERSLSMNMLVEAMGEAGLSDAEKVVDSLPPRVIEELKKLMVRDGQEYLDSCSDSAVKFSFWDFAGQNVFYTTHQTFLSHRAIYILVLDLTRPLNSPIESYRLSRHGQVVDRACPQTVRGYLDYWLNSIHTHALPRDPQQTTLTQPPVMIVCTHKDVLEKEHGKEKAEQMIQEYFLSIIKHLDKKSYSDHVYRKFFAVSNSSSHDVSIDKLRRALVQVAEEQPYWGENIPLKWLALRAKLREMQESEGSVATVNDVMCAAQEVGIHSQEEVTTVLLFYHALGELVFFDEESLWDFVILDPQWLIDNFREVITIRKFHKQQTFPNSRRHWANLDDYGVLNDVILENVWDHGSKEQLVTIMQKFNLILPISKDYQPCDDFEVPDLCESTRLYLVPCMLPQVSPEDMVPVTQVDPAPVLLAFKEGFVPLGLFHRLLATCINQLHWTCFGAVYHDFASFLPSEEEPVTVSLQAKDAVIEVTARSLDLDEEGQGDAGSPFTQCADLLPRALHTLTHQLEQLIRTVSPTQKVFLAVRCTCKGSKQTGALVNLDKIHRRLEGRKRLLCAAHKVAFNCRPLEPWFTRPSDKQMSPKVDITVTAPPPPKEELPSERQLLSLAGQLGYEWEELAIHLGLQKAHLDQCKMDHPHSVVSRITAMLVRWRGRCIERRCSRRVDALIEALRATRRTDLAERVAQWKLEGKDLNLDWDTVDSSSSRC